jgi:hypothetical protein
VGASIGVLGEHGSKTGVPEQQTQSGELVVHQGVHRVQNHDPYARKRKRLRPRQRFIVEHAEHWHEETFGFARARSSRHNDVFAVDQEGANRLSLVLIHPRVEQGLRIIGSTVLLCCCGKPGEQVGKVRR